MYNIDNMLGVLLALYTAAAVAALTNPASLAPHQVSLSLQGASIATLVLMAPYVKTPATALLTVLAGSLVARMAVTTLPSAVSPTDTWVVRWDAFASMAGLLAVVGLAAYEAAGAAVALGTVCLGLPAALALPSMRANGTNGPATLPGYRHLLEKSIAVAAKAYAVHGAGDAEYINDTATGTLAGVSTIDGDTFVFFSGSTSWTDWVRVNANTKLQDFAVGCSVGKVHAGFLLAYMAVRDRVYARFQESVLRAGGSGRIICCGHSLGGALAVLAAADIACRLDPRDVSKMTCVTFGAPNVGDQRFVDAFNALVPISVRVTSTYDPVPKAFSAQLPHVKGQVVVAGHPLMPMSHSLETYSFGITQSPRTTMAVIAAPLVVLVATFWLARLAMQTTTK